MSGCPGRPACGCGPAERSSALTTRHKAHKPSLRSTGALVCELDERDLVQDAAAFALDLDQASRAQLRFDVRDRDHCQSEVRLDARDDAGNALDAQHQIERG